MYKDNRTHREHDSVNVMLMCSSGHVRSFHQMATRILNRSATILFITTDFINGVQTKRLVRFFV